jgi:hypothetical protein
VPHARGALARLAHDGECFRKNLIQDFPLAVLAIVFVARIFNGILNLRLKLRGSFREAARQRASRFQGSNALICSMIGTRST